MTLQSREASRLSIRRHWFRWQFRDGGQLVARLHGLRRQRAHGLQRAIRRLELVEEIESAAEWRAAVLGRTEEGRREQRWIPTEAIDRLAAARPDRGLVDKIATADIVADLTDEETEAVRFLDVDLNAVVNNANEQITTAELTDRRQFFDTIEKSALTDEQARAVICFDNRVQVLAAAGSGKTSVMVARAAYAVERGFVSPNRVLVLAFNKAAAGELQERIDARFAAAQVDATGVRASTFHAFGLDVIGQATGKKPRLASWLNQGEDVAMVLRIVDELRDSSPQFRYRWDLYRTLYASAPADLEEHVPDGYDRATGGTGYRTFAGEVVKSHSERLVANFMYLNGVNYEYERDYEHATADAAHSQYLPDFYYPDIDVWHEHWALDRNGRAPARFKGYAEGMEWKRRIHSRRGTVLVESTWAGVMFGDGLTQLESELSRLGLSFDWNPDRPINDDWAKPMKHEDLARQIRTFMAHVKSNSYTPSDLDAQLASEMGRLDGYRTRLFLNVYWQIHSEWEKKLADEGSVDFEDMLVSAANHLEAGNVDTQYELIMVDEFQDASRARARLVKGLVQAPGRHLLAVGDDWQAINRFAGADISIMTEFESWFGRGPQVALTTTFRCTQTICDVASHFVSKNPAQFNKIMRSVQEEPGPAVQVIRADEPATAVSEYLQELSAAVADGEVPRREAGLVSVDVLGRYGFERDVLPSQTPPNLRVTFRTVHGSKGLEADYVVVPGMSAGTYGFPSTITDDLVLDLAMPNPEDFPHAEERRLFYVAMTRARRQVTLITPTHQMSPFVVELIGTGHVTVDGEEGNVEVCPQCRQGTLTERKGTYGAFVGCSNFPTCTYNRPTRDQTVQSGPKCSRCEDGKMVRRTGKYGRFVGCTNYPACQNAQSL